MTEKQATKIYNGFSPTQKREAQRLFTRCQDVECELQFTVPGGLENYNLERKLERLQDALKALYGQKMIMWKPE